MPMTFVNRKHELKQLERLSDAGKGGLAVLWGRRRVGKTRLLLEWSHRRNGLYLACENHVCRLHPAPRQAGIVFERLFRR